MTESISRDDGRLQNVTENSHHFFFVQHASHEETLATGEEAGSQSKHDLELDLHLHDTLRSATR